MRELVVIAVTGVVFLLLLISFAFRPKQSARILSCLIVAAGVIGALCYGYGFAVVYENAAVATARAVFDVFCMFLGRHDINAVSGVYPLNTPVIQWLFCLAHIIAVYCTANAFVTQLGQGILRRMNLWLIRTGSLNLIYGVNENSLAFAEALAEQRGRSRIVFAGDGSEKQFGDRILHMNSLLLTESWARRPDDSLPRRLGLGRKKRELCVFCLDEDPEKNRKYAEALRGVLERAGIAPERTRLTAILRDESEGNEMQAQGNRYGFGTVTAFERYSLAARLLMHFCPPCRTMEFDEKGRAKGDFHALIIGFGGTGQEILRKLAANAQFEGSRFHAVVVAQDFSQTSGIFFRRCPGLRSHEDLFDIRIIEQGAKSEAVYQYLERHGKEINYAVVCLGDNKLNREVAEELRYFLPNVGSRATITICSKNGVIPVAVGRLQRKGLSSPYTPEILCGETLDKMAKIVNAHYVGENADPEAEWVKCDYYSRMSSRAFADYIDSFLCAAHTDGNAAAADHWPDDPELLENLSRTEHLRWCAFQYTMGYETMQKETLEKRAEQWRQNHSIRITKDTERRLHACLIPWEELDALSASEAAVTGAEVDYQENDRVMIRSIHTMLSAARKTREVGCE